MPICYFTYTVTHSKCKTQFSLSFENIMFVFVLHAFLPLLVIWDIVLQLFNRQWTQEVQREKTASEYSFMFESELSLMTSS